MAVFKCKMCGGALEINSGDSVAVCEYCNTKQTLPRLDDEKRTQLYDRANYFRRENEFDKAMGIYEMILSDATEDCESYWGIVLCRYGIEYVEDPRSHKRIPTVNRAQFTSVFEDEDYKNAVKYADALQKEVYEAEASVIDKIQRGILAISQKEEPFDVFICYKETDSLGNRTQDSVYAQDIYTALTKEGYKVFFSKITLEDKLGSAYEPYIFAALNSAKVMLVVGTTKDNFNAVWVKNEWSRFLSLIKQGKEKTLIPVYKDISPYEMPEEFQFLQSQDMGKIGYLQDLIRGISKLVEINKTTVQETVIINQGYSQAEPLLKRAFMFLEDGDFVKADEFCEQALNIDPENARAYLGKLMVELKVKKQDDLKNLAMPFSANANYQKIIRFADDNLKSEIIGYLNFIAKRNEQQRLEGIYTLALNSLEASKSHTLLLEAAERFESISPYKDSAELAEKCREKAVIAEKDYIYNQANQVFSDTHRWNGKGKRTEDFEEAANLFRSISGWRNADEMVQKCLEGIDEIKAKIEEEKREQKRLEEVAKRNFEKRRKRDSIIAIIIAAIIVLGIIAGIASSLISPIVNYNKAVELMENGEYSKALYRFEDLGGYKDSEDKAIKCKYNYALQLIDQGDYEAGYAILKDLGTDYTDINPVTTESNVDNNSATTEEKYNKAISLIKQKKYHEAKVLFFELGDYKDSKTHYSRIMKETSGKNTIATGDFHTVGLKADGTVIATEYMGVTNHGQCEVSGWTDIVAISAETHHTVGLKADGTVVATEYTGSEGNNFGQCDVSDWTDMVAISAGDYHTVGLKSDGTVVATEYIADEDLIYDHNFGQCDVSGWTDIVAISAGNYHTVGLKADGTVVAVGSNAAGQCAVTSWTDIVAISAGDRYTVGLKADGTVVAVGYNDDGRCDVSDWTNIVAISAACFHTVGLKADGTVVAVGNNDYNECAVSAWTDIVAISTSSYHTVGLKSDGTVVATVPDGFLSARSDVSDWNNIKIP